MKNIEFITRNPHLINAAPIIPMKNYKPNWYKNLDINTPEALRCPFFNKFKFSSHFPTTTIKGCPAVKDYLESGYIIPWPAQVVFETRKQVLGDKIIKSIYTHCSDQGLFGEHTIDQFPELNTNFFKINSPWLIKTPPGYSTLFFQPYFYLEKRYFLFPGIVDTDQMPVPTNFPGYTLQDEFKVEINEPMICVMPFKRDEFKLKMKSSENYNFSRFKMFLKNVYKRDFWTKKKFN